MDAGLLASALQQGFKNVVGNAQLIGGIIKGIGNKRPEYQIPKEAQAALRLSQVNYADPFMPGEQRAYDQNMLAAANAARMYTESGAGVAGAAAVQAGQSKGAMDISVQSAMFKQRQLQNLQGQLGTMAEYKDKQWQMNKFAPYAQRYNESREMIGAGITNISGAMSGMSKLGAAQMAIGGNTPTVNAGQTATGSVSGALQDWSTKLGVSPEQLNNMLSELAKQAR